MFMEGIIIILVKFLIHSYFSPSPPQPAPFNPDNKSLSKNSGQENSTAIPLEYKINAYTFSEEKIKQWEIFISYENIILKINNDIKKIIFALELIPILLLLWIIKLLRLVGL